jgi:hypothetical protein
MLRTPPQWENRVRVARSWYGFITVDLGRWAIGFAFDVAPALFFLEFGPIMVGIERDEEPPESYRDLPDWSGTVCRLVFEKCKLELRLDYDLNIWLFGYSMADAHDHGIYFALLNLQIEYEKFWDWPDPEHLPPRLQCRCDLPTLHRTGEDGPQ